MKTRTKLILLLLLTVVITNCKKNEDGTVSIYKPHYLLSIYDRLTIYDLRDLKNPKGVYAEWDNSIHKFIYKGTYDTLYFPELKQWPQTITDPVDVGYNAHFLNRTNGSTTYNISTGLPITTSTLQTEYPAVPNGWVVPDKVDAYSVFDEFLITPVDAQSRFFFDFASSTYLFYRNGAATEGNITNLIKTPNGNMATDPIDWSLADAGFSFVDGAYPNQIRFVFIDYDAGKYVSFLRKTDALTETGRQTLLTTAWMPLSDIFDVWKF